jgi:hypothetical protein
MRIKILGYFSVTNPRKEIGQLLENGHFKNVQNEKKQKQIFGKSEFTR